MKVLVIGGTGFLGYHAVLELLHRGHTVTVLALPPLPGEDFPAVPVKQANLHQLSGSEIKSLLKGHDAVVFAAGADDRTIPRKPAYAFFYRENVETVQLLIASAKSAGLSKIVILGSYFAYFDRLWPEKRLSERHPYIRSRTAQENEAFRTAGDEIDVIVLELPFIFGTKPGYTPLWAPLIRYLTSPLPLFVPKGGTNMMTAGHVAEAIAGALEAGSGTIAYPIGDENITWRVWFERLVRLTGQNRRIHSLDLSRVKPIFHTAAFFHRIQGREAGLNPRYISDFLTEESFFDPSHSRNILGYGSGGLEAAFQETISACFLH